MTTNLMKHAEDHTILYPLQQGFRKNCSCEAQLLVFVDDVSANMEDGKQTNVLIMDFSKAFDKVSQSSPTHGIRGKTNRWIQVFLSGRTQRATIAACQVSRSSAFWFQRRRFLMFFITYSHGGHLGHVT